MTEKQKQWRKKVSGITNQCNKTKIAHDSAIASSRSVILNLTGDDPNWKKFNSFLPGLQAAMVAMDSEAASDFASKFFSAGSIQKLKKDMDETMFAKEAEQFNDAIGPLIKAVTRECKRINDMHDNAMAD